MQCVAGAGIHALEQAWIVLQPTEITPSRGISRCQLFTLGAVGNTRETETMVPVALHDHRPSSLEHAVFIATTRVFAIRCTLFAVLQLAVCAVSTRHSPRIGAFALLIGLPQAIAAARPGRNALSVHADAVPFFRECTRDLVKHMVGRLATNQPAVHLDTCTGIGILALELALVVLVDTTELSNKGVRLTTRGDAQACAAEAIIHTRDLASCSMRLQLAVTSAASPTGNPESNGLHSHTFRCALGTAVQDTVVAKGAIFSHITFAVLFVREDSVAAFATEFPHLRAFGKDVVDGLADFFFSKLGVKLEDAV
mmetsp:Transcript_105399/g.251002  ORF Transcript_105399/g.251002 Transcript_105399/m.251002 type:complete len:311 (-) Transcript_105399:1342-2274(-)